MSIAPRTSAASLPSGGGAASPGEFALILDAAGAARLVIPSADGLLKADFVRAGSDLILIAPDGAKILITNYFSLDRCNGCWRQNAAGCL